MIKNEQNIDEGRAPLLMAEFGNPAHSQELILGNQITIDYFFEKNKKS